MRQVEQSGGFVAKGFADRITARPGWAVRLIQACPQVAGGLLVSMAGSKYPLVAVGSTHPGARLRPSTMAHPLSVRVVRQRLALGEPRGVVSALPLLTPEEPEHCLGQLQLGRRGVGWELEAVWREAFVQLVGG